MKKYSSPTLVHPSTYIKSTFGDQCEANINYIIAAFSSCVFRDLPNIYQGKQLPRRSFINYMKIGNRASRV